MAKRKDGIRVTGIFRCKVFENGKLVREIEDKNLVVTLGLEHLATALTGSNPPGVTQIGVGEGSAAPAAGDTALSADNFHTAIDNAARVGSSTVFTWSIDTSEANGIDITEFGLCFGDNTLFARKTGVTISKNNTISLSGTWTINFSAT